MTLLMVNKFEKKGKKGKKREKKKENKREKKEREGKKGKCRRSVNIDGVLYRTFFFRAFHRILCDIQ